MSREQLFILILSLIAGLLLRLGWNPHQIIWSYDQARDSFFMRQMVENRHIILLGPQAEQYGLFHGPLYYYLFAPIFALSRGETNLPILWMTILNFSSVIPLALLATKLTKSKWAGIFVVVIFSLSYAFVEYARWLSNVSITIPFISWAYFLFYKILDKKFKKIYFFLLGLMLGLATQGELFFLSLIAVFFLLLIIRKINLISLLSYLLGAIVGIAPIIIAQFKFKFMGAKIFSNLFTQAYQNKAIEPGQAFIGYLNHLGLTTYQTIGGLSAPMGLFIFILLVPLVSWVIVRKFPKSSGIFLSWFLTILLAHTFLFTFEYVDTFFVDLSLAILLVVLMGIGADLLFISNRLLFIVSLIGFLIFQTGLYKSYLVERKPFGHYMFVQKSSTLSHLDEIVAKIYEYAQGRPFTFSSIGTPFGVRTVWASVFELYSREHKVFIPKWYGYFANGYLGETLLQEAKDPGQLHILVIESNAAILLPQPIFDTEMNHQNEYTELISELKLNDTKIQFRKPKKV